MEFLPFRFFLFLFLWYVMYEKKGYSLIIQARILQVKLAQLVLYSILTYVSSLASKLDEWCGVMLQHEFCAQQGCAQVTGTNVLNVRGMRFNCILTHLKPSSLTEKISKWSNCMLVMKYMRMFGKQSTCSYEFFFLPCYIEILKKPRN